VSAPDRNEGRSEAALLYQFAGESHSGLSPDGSPDNWRCVRVDELLDVSIRKAEGEWNTSSNYSAMQTCVRQSWRQGRNDCRLTIHILAMPNAEHEDKQDSAMHLIHNPIIACPNPPRVGNSGHLLASCWERIVSQGVDPDGQIASTLRTAVFPIAEPRRT
jgi:hypothetical protein